MGVRGAPYPFDEAKRPVDIRPIYSGRGGFAPSTFQNARALLYLLAERRADIWHFVFAPSPRTTAILRKLRSVRKTRVVQTIASPPKNFEQARELIFGDVVVVQSAWTERRLQEHYSELRCSVIPPSAPHVVIPDRSQTAALRQQLAVPEGTEVVVYPGDLEFSRGSQHFATLVETLGAERKETVFVYACRAKTEAAARVEQTLKERLQGHNVRFTGELPSLLPLLAIATLVVFPTDSAFGKVDIPIALLEAMRLRVPVVTFGFGPLQELEGTLRLEENAGALLEATRQLLQDAGKRETMVQEQLAFLDAALNPADAARRYEQLYAELAARPH
jgi:glycosyltransferase involved in cell wall biosynthesis